MKEQLIQSEITWKAGSLSLSHIQEAVFFSSVTIPGSNQKLLQRKKLWIPNSQVRQILGGSSDSRDKTDDIDCIKFNAKEKSMYSQNSDLCIVSRLTPI